MAEDDKAAEASRADVDALLKKQDWGRIYAELHAFAKRRGKRGADAEDLVQEAIRRVLDPTWKPWNPEKHPSLVDFLTGIMSRDLANTRASARVHREIAMDREAKDGTRERKIASKAERVADSAPQADARMMAGEPLARRLKVLRADVAEDEVVAAILAQEELGNDEASDQAVATGYSIEEVREGRRRLARHLDRVAREIPA